MCPRAAARPETQVKRQEETRWLTPSGRCRVAEGQAAARAEPALTLGCLPLAARCPRQTKWRWGRGRDRHLGLTSWASGAREGGLATKRGWAGSPAKGTWMLLPDRGYPPRPKGMALGPHSELRYLGRVEGDDSKR